MLGNGACAQQQQHQSSERRPVKLHYPPPSYGKSHLSGQPLIHHLHHYAMGGNVISSFTQQSICVSSGWVCTKIFCDSGCYVFNNNPSQKLGMLLFIRFGCLSLSIHGYNHCADSFCHYPINWSSIKSRHTGKRVLIIWNSKHFELVPTQSIWILMCSAYCVYCVCVCVCMCQCVC